MPQEITQQEIKLSEESIIKLASAITAAAAQKKWLTVKEAAEYLNCSESGLRGYMKNKKISYYKFNGIVLFKTEELDRIIENSRVESISDTIQKATDRGR